MSSELFAAEIETLAPPEDNNEISQINSAMAGIASGIIKVPEGVISLGAELIDLGAGTDYATKVEQAFDKINIFEETAQEAAAGKIVEALIQIGVPSVAGAKLATTLASKALKAKKAGRYLNPRAKNLLKGSDKAKKLNKLSNKQKFAAIAVGGAAGETLVADVENIGTIGDVFEAGPTELDRDVQADPSADAGRKLLNRIKFGAEAIPAIYAFAGAGSGIKALATRGKKLAYSDKKLERIFDKIGGFFRPRGTRPQEVFNVQRTEKGRLMSDTNFALEKVKRIDQDVDKMFPEVKSFLNKTTEDGRGAFLKEINDLMFEGDLKKGLPTKITTTFLKRAKKLGADAKTTSSILKSVTDVRNKFSELMDITAQGSVGMTAAPGKKLQTNLRELMGDRVKQYIGTTYRIFQNENFGFYSRYKPTDDSMMKAKEVFIRYAAKNKNPITEEEAEMLVNNVLNQAKAYNPKTKLPSFRYDNLSQGANTPENFKTFAQTLEKELPDGSKELKVIGKGSKIFRDLFGEVEDARYSIFEGMNRLGTIARKNQVFDEILDVDQALKDAATATTPAGARGFFFSSPVDARKSLPNRDIVKIDDYVQEYFNDGVLINRLQGQYTSKEIAEAFGNASRVSQWMRGESNNSFATSASWAYRNLFLTPKAFSQYAKTILSVPTHFRNFFSSAGFALANGALVNPVYMVRGMNEARKTLNLGLRDPKAMAKYREYLELGVTNTNVRMGDIKNLMRDAKFFEDGNIATDSILKPMLNSLGKIGEATKRAGRKGAAFMQDAYIAEDDFWKITMYETEVARRGDLYRKAGIKKTAQQVKEEAADIVKNTIPNYAYVGDFVRAMRAAPLGNFMSWPSEVFRTGFGIMKQALKDIRDPVTGSLNYYTSTNVMKGQGLARLVGGTTAFAALPAGVVYGTRAIFGVSDDEAKAVQESGVAPWSKNSQLIVTKDPKTGELSYSDWSSNNVYDTLTRPFTTLLRAVQSGIDNEEVLMKGIVDGLTQAAAETADPFIGESIFTEAMTDIAVRKGRTRDGYQLYTENTPDPEKWMRRFKHVVATQAPQYKQLLKVYNSTTGQLDKNGDVIEIDEALAGVFGFKLIPVKPEKALGFHINKYQQNARESRREFTGGPEGTLRPMKTAEDVIERYFVSNKQLFQNEKQMNNHIKNLKLMGLNKKQIATVFDKRGLKRNYGFLTKNRFKSYFPSKGIQEKFIDIAKESGQPNPFKEALPVIKKIYKDMLKQNLMGDFNLKLEDYLPSTPDQVSAPLPLQPQPNPQVVSSMQQQTPNVMQSGLTPTEGALLSEEEKMIALRNRGLV